MGQRQTWHVSNYATAYKEAAEHLAKGRNKYRRPLASNTSLVRVADDAIAVVLHYTPVVTYRADGSIIIYGGGWNTVTTKQRIGEFSPFRCTSVKGSWILGDSGERTPARVGKCRSCKGRPRWMQPVYCYGTPGPSRHLWYPSPDIVDGWCPGGTTGYAVPCGQEGWWESRFETPCVHGHQKYHQTAGCKHGFWQQHKIDEYEQTCHRCNGTGMVDYGSKPVWIMGDADQAFAVDAHGSFVELVDGTTLSTSALYTPPPKPKKVEQHISGQTVMAGLKAVVPGITAQVKHPVRDRLASLETVIIDLNDVHGWTPQRVADWLETLDVDLSFQVAS